MELTSNNGSDAGHVEQLVNLEFRGPLFQLLALFDSGSGWQEVQEPLHHAESYKFKIFL